MLLLLILPVKGICQEYSNRDEVPTNLKTAFYSIAEALPETCPIHLPFKKINVVDARFDTSKLGFEISKKFIDVNFKDFKKIRLEGGTQKSLEKFYNEYYKSCLEDSSGQLLIVLKTLWIDNVPNRSFKETRRTDIIKKSYQDIHTKIEFYLQKVNEYYPLKKIDTVYQLTEQNLPLFDTDLKINDLSFFIYTLKDIIEKRDFNVLLSNATNRRKLTFNQIDSFNNKRFQLPILVKKDINEGVFINFNEFSNNKPSIKDYKIDKFGILKLKTDSIDSKNYWAVRDESGLHLWAHSKLDSRSFMRAPVRSDIVRTENTFEFFIFDQIMLPTTVGGSIARFLLIDIDLGSGGKVRSVMIPRQINMETGEVY